MQAHSSDIKLAKERAITEFINTHPRAQKFIHDSTRTMFNRRRSYKAKRKLARTSIYLEFKKQIDDLWKEDLTNKGFSLTVFTPKDIK